MKKTLLVILVLILSLALFAGCSTETPNVEGTKTEPAAVEETKAEETKGNIINPLPETLDINNLYDCTVSASLEKGDAYVDDSGKMVMKLKVYSYEMYDMADIASLKENDVIVRQNKEVTVTKIERLDSGLVRINDGEENGGFDLISNDSTVYYEIGMNDAKAYYELGEVTLPVSTEFMYFDESDPNGEATEYYPGDFLIDSGIEYNFNPNNTLVLIEDGVVIEMHKFYNP